MRMIHAYYFLVFIFNNIFLSIAYICFSVKSRKHMAAHCY